MAKVRVHELAKKYDVPSKDVLKMLGELGEFVKAPSSTVEPPVVKRFEDKYGAELLAKAEAKAAKKAAKKAPAKKAARPPRPARRPLPPRSRPRSPPRTPAAKAAPRARSARQGRPSPRAEAPAEPEAAAEPGGAGRPRGDRDRGRLRRRRRPSEGARFKPGPRPARPGAPRPGNNPFSSTQGMGTPPGPAPGCRPATTSVRRARRRVAATACRAPTRR